YVSLNNSTYLFVLIASCVCGLLAYNASLVYLYYTDHSLFQKSRPAFAHAMNAGTILIAASIAVASSIVADPLSCSILWCIADLSFVLVFGTILLRLYRNVCVLLSSAKGPPIKFPDKWVFALLGGTGLDPTRRSRVVMVGLLLIEAGILAGVWAFRGFTMHDTPLWPNADGVTWTKFQGCFLDSQHAAIALIAPKGLTLLVIVAFALQLRRSKKEERDMTKLASCVAITLALWAIGLSLYGTATKAHGDMFYLCLVFLLLLPSAMVVAITTYPKWIEIHRLGGHFTPTVRPSTKNSADLNLYLHHIDWHDVAQVEEAETQLTEFVASDPRHGLDIGTILMLLSDKVRHRGIRRLAVAQLQHADVASVSLVFPQLLQALKYDLDADVGDVAASPLVQALLRYARESIVVAHTFHWSVVVELENTVAVVVDDMEIKHQDRPTKALYAALHELFLDAMATTAHGHLVAHQIEIVSFLAHVYDGMARHHVDAMTIQLREALTGPEATFSSLHPLYPSIWVRGFDPAQSFVFKSNAKPMKVHLVVDTAAQLEHITVDMRSALDRTASTKAALAHIRHTVDVTVADVRGSSTNATIRIDVHGHVQTCTVDDRGGVEARFEVGEVPQLVELLLVDGRWNEYGTGPSSHSGGNDTTPSRMLEVHLPPSLYLPPTEMQMPDSGTINRLERGVAAHAHTDVYATVSVIVTSHTTHGHDDATKEGLARAVTEKLHGTIDAVSPGIIFKHGDDLRQDALALQLLAVIDLICTRHGQLHLHFTLYRVLATSVNEGIAEFVPHSAPLSQVLRDNHHSILEFLQRHQFDADAPNQVKPHAMDIFVRSVAGYCVATYVLGVGDRHLDNLMLKSTGHFFHIDFGFLFGKDPKPMPPPFRLTPDMVHAMGGLDGEAFQLCIAYACECFNLLRKHAHVLLAVLHLTKEAGIPHMHTNLNQEKDVAIHEVEKRLVLRASSEKARQFMTQLMVESQNPQTTARLSLLERIHRVAVALK
ncbi:hypothetical protein DYB32_007136, partial [Aphanomyces invadans]